MFFIVSTHRERQIDIDLAISEHAGAITRCAYLYLRDQSAAEDACQEAFLRYWKHAPYLGDSQATRAWLMRVTINICRDQLRAPWRRRVVLTSELELAQKSSGAQTESEVIERERDANLYAAVIALDIKYREPIILHYYFEYSQQQAAEMLDISYSALRSRLMRGREKLHAALGEEIEL